MYFWTCWYCEDLDQPAGIFSVMSMRLFVVRRAEYLLVDLGSQECNITSHEQ